MLTLDLKRISLCSLVIIGSLPVILAVPGVSQAGTISVTSTLLDCDGNPLTVELIGSSSCLIESSMSVRNGDFTIFDQDPTGDNVIGNGISDRTLGLFDFRGSSGFDAFRTELARVNHVIDEASLTLAVTPLNGFFFNDSVLLGGLPFIPSPNPFNSLTRNATTFVTLNMLDYYTSEQLENIFFTGEPSGNTGVLRMIFGDDSVVSLASLRLSTNVPIPGTIVLLGPLAAGLLSRRSRRRPSWP